MENNVLKQLLIKNSAYANIEEIASQKLQERMIFLALGPTSGLGLNATDLSNTAAKSLHVSSGCLGSL
jgi:hypothetical protein